MSRSVSFLRRINFSKPLGHVALWIESADLYEDENRIYAFLTFSSGVNPTIEKCKIRITPFDKDKYGMDPFLIKISNLDLKKGNGKEHPDPLILPKGTYGFNFSIVSYATKKIEENVPSVASAPSGLDGDAEPVVPEGEPSQEAPKEAAPASPVFETPVRNANKAKPIRRFPFYLVIILILLVGAIGCWLFYSGLVGKNFHF